MVTKEWSDWNNCSYWWIQSVYVKPEYRGQGAFKAQECYHKLGMDECHYLMYEESFK